MGDTNFQNIFSGLSLPQLLDCRDVLNKCINQVYNERDNEIRSKNIMDYVVYDGNFLSKDSVELNCIKSEVESLGLKCNNNNTATSWLTTTNQEYKWKTGSGKFTVKKPVNFEQYPGIKNIMADINDKYGTDLNSCLVGYMENGLSTLRPHDDNEPCFDKTQPICVVTVGAPRKVEFLNKYSSEKPVHSITPNDGSIYTMKPGCQDFFNHQIRADRRVKHERFSLSFRRMIPIPKNEHPVPVSSIEDEIISVEKSGHKKLNNQITAPADHTSVRRKRTTVLFGTSITQNIIESKIAGRNRRFINVSRSGAKIRDIIGNVEYFYKNNTSAGDIEKIIFNLGTNDIKFSHRGVGHLKKYIVELVTKTRMWFPDSMVIFQCCLPIKNVYYFTASNVLELNKILKDVCDTYLNCLYNDCFRYFLDSDYYDYNSELYRDWLHLNKNGLGILCSWIKYIVHQDSFNNVIAYYGVRRCT